MLKAKKYKIIRKIQKEIKNIETEMIEKEQAKRNSQRFKQWATKVYQATHKLPVQNPIYPI